MEQIFNYLEPSKEMNVVLSLAIDEDAADSIVTNIQDIEWQNFRKYVYKNAIPSLVAKGIKKLPSSIVHNNEVLKNMQVMPPYYKVRCMKQIHALAMIAREFEQAQVPVLSLKGPLLAVEIYGNPEFRLSSDLDLLVAEEHLENACECLTKMGYQEKLTVYDKTPKRRALRAKQHEDMHRVFVKEDMIIELHWRISFRWEQSFEELWKNKREKRLLGQTVNILGEIDNISYLICHAAGHGYKQIRWLLDLYYLLNKPEIDMVSLHQDMKSKGIAMMLFETLILLYRCKNFQMRTIQNELFCFVQKEAQIEIQYAESIEEDFCIGSNLAETVWPLLLKISNDEGYTGRKYNQMLPQLEKRPNLICSFFQPRKADLELIDLPDCLFFVYYLIRPFCVLWRKTPFYHADHQHE